MIFTSAKQRSMQPTSSVPCRLQFRACFCALIHSLSTALASDYRLEIAARPEDFPPDPQATQRNYLHRQINNSGDILFSAHWRDSDGLMRSAIYAGPPGDVRPVVEGGDPIAEFPGFRFTGGPDRVSLGNFPSVSFNAQGEVWFNGFIYGEAPGGDLPFLEGLWKASGGNVELLGAIPGFNPNFSFPFNVGNVPYSGTGRLQWTDRFGAVRMADNGEVIFTGNVGAFVNNVGIEFVFNFGLIRRSATNGLQVITYPGDDVPGTNDWAFNSFGLYHVGHKNGAYVLDATLEGTRTNVNLGQRKRVFYWGRYGGLLPVYTEKDPLPDLPPLSEVLGTGEPFDLLSNLEGADGTGNFVFNVSASARNRIAGAPMGLWKWDQAAGKLVKVFRFQEPLPTPGGPVILNTNVAVRAKIGNNKTVFVAAFTGLGYTTPTTGLFQENGTNFTLIAATGMAVPGTNVNFVLGPNIGSGLITSAFWANESNDVLFAASARENGSGPALQGMFAWRDGSLHRVISAGQTLRLGETDKTISRFGHSALDRVFNDLGMFFANVFLVDGTSVMVRCDPQFELPEPEGYDFHFNPKIDNNWHSGSGLNSNWEDSEGEPQLQPGEALPGEAVTYIDDFNVLLDQRPASIGSLRSRGQLAIRDHLTLNQTSVLDRLFIDAPRGALTANSQVTITDELKWRGGPIDGSGVVVAENLVFTNGGIGELKVALQVTSALLFTNNGTIQLSNTDLRGFGRFVAESGLITNVGGLSLVENNEQFVKIGTSQFTISAPFSSFKQIDVEAGLLRLIDGGNFARRHTTTIRRNAELELAGVFTLDDSTFDGDGELNLGNTAMDAELRVRPGSTVVLDVRSNSVQLHRGSIRGSGTVINKGHFVWRGGSIDMDQHENVVFTNRGQLTIEAADQPRRLVSRFVNGEKNDLDRATVEQRGSMELAGFIRNWGSWRIVEPITITAPSPSEVFANNGDLVVDLTSPGTVTLETALAMTLSSDPVGYVRGYLQVGRQRGANPQTTLRLLGTSPNYPNGLTQVILDGGGWSVGENCTLEFPYKISVIEEFTLVEINGGNIPALELSHNSGRLTFYNKEYSTPRAFDNLKGLDFFSRLLVHGTSKFSVNGNLTNYGTIECVAPAEIVVQGDLISSLDSTIINNGRISATGDLTLGYVEGSGEFECGNQSTATFTEEAWVGSSPGTLSVKGSTKFLNTATLVMELAGTQNGTFDLLSVSRNAALGGTLVVHLLDDFRPAPGDSFPIVQAATISGQFSNAPNGQRIDSIDGFGSFLVTYTATNVVLTAFEPAANPALPARAALTSLRVNFGTVIFNLAGTPGRAYIVDASSDLTNWLPFKTNVVRFDGLSSLEVPLSPEPRRFFRARAR